MLHNEDSNSIQDLFMRASHSYFQKSFRQLNNIGLRPGQPPVLWHLAREDGLSQRELARRLRVKPPTVNVSLRRMEKAEYIYREQDTKDQRVSRIFLTEKGRNLVAQIDQIMRENEIQITRNFTEAELCLLTRFLRQLIENIEND